MSDKIIVEQIARVKLIRLNRPHVMNAVDIETMDELRKALLSSENDDTRVVVITGSNGSFCSGADIKSAMASKLTPDQAVAVLQDSYGPTLRAIKNLKWPVIAAIDGAAAGIGLDLALACDIRLASKSATLSELFIKVGLIPDGGGTWSLRRLIGPARAMEMTFTGESVPATKALEWGLVNRVYQIETFEEDVLNFASNIARQSPDALSYGKKAIREAATGTYEDALDREAAYQKKIFEGEWGFEGFKAFVEKRRPKWMDE